MITDNSLGNKNNLKMYKSIFKLVQNVRNANQNEMLTMGNN